MRRKTSVLTTLFVSVLLFLLFSLSSPAQDTLVPAGTLLRCTMSEPNFSSATAQVGDPVLCHLGAVQVFGHNVFPRGAYMGGHLEAEKEPGHFIGKGYLKIVFDRIALPNSELPLDTKIVAARGYHVDKEGDVKGNGHAKRDVVEWLFPPLWPWKVIMLPARGPRPTLKGEEILTLRLMEDVTVPKFSATYSPRDDRPPYAQNHVQPSAYPATRQVAPAPAGTAPAATVNASYVSPPNPRYARTSQIPQQAAQSTQPAVQQTRQQTAIPRSTVASKSLTLLALSNETIYAVTEYWLDGERLDYLLPSGTRGACNLNQLDLVRTTQLNSERGIGITFSEGSPTNSSALN
jgi:hypothetical protein